MTRPSCFPISWRQLCLAAAFALTLSTITPAACQAASPSGRWRGSWSSQTIGHRGPLRARVRAVDHDTYRALFVGRFAGVVPFVYPATLDRVPGTCNQYTSTQRLPLLGSYRMTATVSGRNLNARFQGPRDRGTFRLSR